MLSDAIKEPHDSMVRPVRVSYFDPRTGEPCDSRPEPLRREKQRETVEERNAAKVVRTVRECAVCGRSFEVPGKSRKLTYSEACAKVRKRERELAWKAATRGAADAHAQMDSPRTAAPSLVSVVK